MRDERDGGVVLACLCRPPSVNNATGKGRERFGAELAISWEAAGRPRLDGLLYGVVCWFTLGYRPSTDPDADNISKGVWDVLSDPTPRTRTEQTRLGAFTDDKQVRLRVASIFDLRLGEAGAPNLDELDLTSVPVSIVEKIRQVAGGEGAFRHLTYIRFGKLNAAAYNRLAFPGGGP